jgi:hypothetical protein
MAPSAQWEVKRARTLTGGVGRAKGDESRKQLQENLRQTGALRGAECTGLKHCSSLDTPGVSVQHEAPNLFSHVGRPGHAVVEVAQINPLRLALCSDKYEV